jgi:hypothetical protein
MNIAIIGGGIFGATAAIRLAKEGHTVTLFEKRPDLFQAATGINQYRLHRGYHYPRSDHTIRSCSESVPLFEEEYGEALIKDIDHFYAIAKEGSLVDGKQFLGVCTYFDLPIKKEIPSFLNAEAVDVCIRGDEYTINPFLLAKITKERLQKNGVKVLLNTEADINELKKKYDFVVIATYADLNKTLGKVYSSSHHQYELCEKIVVKLPPEFKKQSCVILDGPFTCFDPYGDTDYFVMGHVEHAIHSRNVGEAPLVPDEFKTYLNAGLIKNPKVTNFKKFIDSATLFFPKIAQAEHIGSLYTIRTVLPNVEKTDARPTLVQQIDENIVSVFSGKIGTCVRAAEDISQIINAQE